ncbi:HPr-rel-A system PqqD family peptide chaperone [Sphingomonas sp. FW199]|uniref:HPr-rel-A system PqqD family peptide chaperone n=1 Tax=Sphingomonas sp. FW199 TaxID=3400217 RepID=UPI003CF3E3B8
MTRYRAAPPETLLTVPLDALTAIHDRRSGQTHLVAAPVPELLEALGDGALDAAALLARLAEQFDLVDGDAAALAERLEELTATGLVERL